MKTVFITGSTRGIGQAIAFEFAKNNHTVILNGTKESPKTNKLIGRIKKISKKSAIYYFDVSDFEQVQDNCRRILKEFKKVDVLVNNAGIVRDKSLMKMDLEDWDKVIKTNLYGPFFITKIILPGMIKQNFGRIINISSIIGLTGNFGQTNYSASKAGLIGFTKSLAKETAKHHITVNAVCPGFAETDMVASVPAEILKTRILPKIALGRLALPSEIAKLVYFLSSEDAGYITGEYISINGGFS